MSASGGGATRLRHSLKSSRPEDTSLPGEDSSTRKRARPAPVALWHVWCSSTANVLVPLAFTIGNLIEWGRLAAASWYCLPKVALLIAKLAAVAWLSQTHSIAPEKKDIDLDQGAMKYALYLWRVLVDVSVAPLWYHFLEGKLFVLTPSSAAVGALLGVSMWVAWLVTPKLLVEFRVKYTEAWNPYSFYGPGAKAHGFVAARMLHTCTLSAVVDELYFRGFMCRWLAHYFQYTSAPSFVDVSLRELHPFAALVTVALYSAARTRNSSEIPFWATFWLLNHMLTMTYGCLGPACIASGTFNLLVAAWIVTQKEWYLW